MVATNQQRKAQNQNNTEKKQQSENTTLKKHKEKLLKELALGLNQLYKDNPTPETRMAIAAILATQSEGMTHFIRTLSLVKF